MVRVGSSLAKRRFGSDKKNQYFATRHVLGLSIMFSRARGSASDPVGIFRALPDPLAGFDEGGGNKRGKGRGRMR